MKQKYIHLLLTLLMILLLASPLSAGKTKFVTKWSNPEAEPVNWKGQKIATFVVAQHETIRLGGEQTLAHELTSRGAKGVPGYTLVPTELAKSKDQEKVKQILEEAGVVGAVVLTVTGQDTDVYGSPGSVAFGVGYYPTFWGYWGYGWSSVIYSPGTVNTERVISIDTLVYSVKDNTLLWAGRSRTTNPDGVPKTIRTLVDKVGKEMRKAGLLGK